MESISQVFTSLAASSSAKRDAALVATTGVLQVEAVTQQWRRQPRSRPRPL
jgi:hypothetical protein